MFRSHLPTYSQKRILLPLTTYLKILVTYVLHNKVWPYSIAGIYNIVTARTSSWLSLRLAGSTDRTSWTEHSTNDGPTVGGTANTTTSSWQLAQKKSKHSTTLAHDFSGLTGNEMWRTGVVLVRCVFEERVCRCQIDRELGNCPFQRNSCNLGIWILWPVTRLHVEIDSYLLLPILSAKRLKLFQYLIRQQRPRPKYCCEKLFVDMVYLKFYILTKAETLNPNCYKRHTVAWILGEVVVHRIILSAMSKWNAWVETLPNV